MIELRILSGLHRGATLPLNERPLVVGASEDADVVLVDPDIEAQHATLTLTAQGWSLSALGGTVLGAEHNRPFTSLDLQVGDFARLGHVWLTVVDSESRWQSPPPEPAQSDASDAAMGADSLHDEQPALQADAGGENYEPYRDSPLDDQQNAEARALDGGGQEVSMAEEAAAEAMAKKAGGKHPRAGRNRLRPGWRRSKMVIAPLALVTILSACAAYTISSRSKKDSALKTSVALSASSSAASQPSATAAEPRTQTASKTSPQPMSQQELREAFRKRLRDVDLLKRFDLKLKDNDWKMQAALDDEEAARFERILTSFIHTHNITFPVNAKVGSSESMLPFRIREVVSGANASVVTEDGNRLYIGDEYLGVRLAAVDGHQLKFEGERKIKVKW